jgi:FixJ family two-component response regulator
MTSYSRTIAVVDDDAAVCDSTHLLLETHGFEVLSYESAERSRVCLRTTNPRKPRADHHDHSDD